MTLDESLALKPGDVLVATTDGRCLGPYIAGDRATVVGHDPLVYVEFADGRIGHPDRHRWKKANP